MCLFLGGSEEGWLWVTEQASKLPSSFRREREKSLIFFHFHELKKNINKTQVRARRGMELCLRSRPRACGRGWVLWSPHISAGLSLHRDTWKADVMGWCRKHKYSPAPAAESCSSNSAGTWPCYGTEISIQGCWKHLHGWGKAWWTLTATATPAKAVKEAQVAFLIQSHKGILPFTSVAWDGASWHNALEWGLKTESSAERVSIEPWNPRVGLVLLIACIIE